MSRPLRRVIAPVIVLLLWLALLFAALFRQLRDGPDWLAIAIIVVIGLFGAIGLGRSIARRIKESGRL